MMRLAYDAGELDIVRSGGNLELDTGLETAVLLSVFSDLTDEGWWGDAFSPLEGDLLGSRLWEAQRGRDVPATLRAVEDDVRSALNWLIADGVAESVTVTANRIASGRMSLDVSVERGGGRRWQGHWEVLTDAV